MGCRVGMTTNPQARRQDWEREYPNLYNWQIIRDELTYDQALLLEERVAQRYGCDAHGGGPRVEGSVYSVYKFNF